MDDNNNNKLNVRKRDDFYDFDDTLFKTKTKNDRKNRRKEKEKRRKLDDSCTVDDPASQRLSFLSAQSVKIEKRWNVFRSIPRNLNVFEPQWSLLTAQILKILLYIVLHLSVLSLGFLSKMLLLLMTSNMRQKVSYTPCLKSGHNLHWIPLPPVPLPLQYTAYFYWSLWLGYCFPEMLTLFRSIRVVCFKFVPTPKLNVIFYFLILELTRSIGVCILIFGVLPQLDAVRGFMLLACLASVPSFLNFLTKLSANMNREGPLSKYSFATNVVDFLCFLCQMTGLFVWSIFDHSLSLELRITIPVALILTSLLWWENFVSRASTSGVLSSLGRFKDRLRRCRYKLMLIAVPCKCLASLACMCVFGIRAHSSFHLFDLNNPFEIYSMNKTGPNVDLVKLAKSEQANHAMWLCISFLLFSWVCFELAKFACKVKMDWFSVALPLILSMPVALTALVSFCEEKRQQSCYRVPWIDEKLFWFCGYGRNVSDGLLVEHLGWIWPFWFFSYLWVVSHVFTQKIGRLNRSDTIFVTPIHSGFLIDHSLSLNRRRHNMLMKKLSDMDDDFLHEESMAPPTEAGSSSDVSNSCSMTSLSMANSRADTIPKIYICATMWHETRVEMTQMLKSILKMDEDQSARKNAQRYLKVVDPDYYELEAHIFFDDAWEQDEQSNDRIPNFYVKQFVDVIDHAASSVHKVDKILKSPVKIDVPYGGRLVWTLPGDNRLFVHLKDKTKIRNKKRWSQVMYMYYLFGHRIMEMVPDIHRKQILADNTYLLTIDGDSKFDPSSVQKLIDLMKKHNRLGSACGRIHPIGGGIMVLYQKFEYAIAHWFQKAAEHVFGCVLCSPGCFSLFRASALMDDNVMQKYTKLPTEPRHFVQYDQGEDRWLSTLLLKQGYRIEYAAAADAETYAPESFDEFFNQRRRWTPSSIANTLDLLADYKRAVHNNDSLSRCYVFYQTLVIFFSMLGPAIIFSMLIFAQVAAFRVRSQVVFVTNALPVVTFCVLCFTAKSSIQLNFAKILSVIYAFLMMAVMVGTGIQITTEGSGSPITIYVFLTTAVFCWAACLHPKEFMNIFYGVIFFLMIPTTYLLMSLYSLINLNVVNWGTREAAQKAVGAEITETVVEKWLRKLKRKKAGLVDSPDSLEAFGHQKLANAENARIFCGCSNFFECFLCPQEEKSTKDEKLMWMGQQLETINEKLDHLTGEGSSKKRKEKPSLTVTLPTPGRAQISDVSSNAASPSKLRPMLGRRKSNVHVAPVSSDDADAESGDGTSIDSSLDDFGPPKPYRYDSQNGSTPKWMTLDYLNDCPHDILDEMENQFWVNFIEDHLKPLQKTPDEEIRVAKSLIVYRNQISFALLMANALLVLALYLAQMNKDIVAIKMMPSANYTIIKWDDKEGTFKASQEPLQVEALGLVIIIFLALILIVQTFGMFLHRWQTLQHIVASTVLPCFRRRASKKEEGHEILEGNAVEIAKRLQKLNDDDQGDSDGKIHNQGRHNIVFKLERARKRKHKSKCLQAAFQKRFFSFNPDKHRKSLRGIQFDKNNALFQKESTRKAAAVELKRRRDSILQQDASDLERKISLGLSKAEPSGNVFDDRRKFLTNALQERFLKPTKLIFDASDKSSNEMEQSSAQPSTSAATAVKNDQSRASGSGVSNQSDLGNKSNVDAAGAGLKTVSFLEDLERILKNRRLPPKSP